MGGRWEVSMFTKHMCFWHHISEYEEAALAYLQRPQSSALALGMAECLAPSGVEETWLCEDPRPYCLRQKMQERLIKRDHRRIKSSHPLNSAMLLFHSQRENRAPESWGRVHLYFLHYRLKGVLFSSSRKQDSFPAHPDLSGSQQGPRNKWKYHALFLRKRCMGFNVLSDSRFSHVNFLLLKSLLTVRQIFVLAC